MIGDGCGSGELDGEVVVVVVDGGMAEGDEPGDGDVAFRYLSYIKITHENFHKIHISLCLKAKLRAKSQKQ